MWIENCELNVLKNSKKDIWMANIQCLFFKGLKPVVNGNSSRDWRITAGQGKFAGTFN